MEGGASRHAHARPQARMRPPNTRPPSRPSTCTPRNGLLQCLACGSAFVLGALWRNHGMLLPVKGVSLAAVGGASGVQQTPQPAASQVLGLHPPRRVNVDETLQLGQRLQGATGQQHRPRPTVGGYVAPEQRLKLEQRQRGKQQPMQEERGGNKKNIRKPPSRVLPIEPPPLVTCRRPSANDTEFLLGNWTFQRAPNPVDADSRDWLRRGVIITANGQDTRQAVGTYVTVYILRVVLHSSMPIEIYYVGADQDFSKEHRAALEALGRVELIDLIKQLDEILDEYPGSDGLAYPYVRPTQTLLSSYAAKPYSVLASRLSEVVLFDAGAIPFYEPNVFFDLSSYKATGFQVFRDYVPAKEDMYPSLERDFCANSNVIESYLHGTEADSSCVLFDKRKNWDALLAACILNGPFQEATYKRLNGDKELWAMGMTYFGHELVPLETVAGYLFVGDGNGTAAKVMGQLQLQILDADAVPTAKRRKGLTGSKYRPLYINNQRYLFNKWDTSRAHTYYGSYDDFGQVYGELTADGYIQDCNFYPVKDLGKLTREMHLAFDGVVQALAVLRSDHCNCRDDWPMPICNMQ